MDFSDSDWRVREDPSVNVIFIRDAWRASPCRVSHNSKCGGVLRALGAVAMAADLAKVVKPRMRVSATPSYSGFVGAGSDDPTRADHRETSRVREPSRFMHGASGSERDARLHEKSGPARRAAKE